MSDIVNLHTGKNLLVTRISSKKGVELDENVSRVFSGICREIGRDG